MPDDDEDVIDAEVVDGSLKRCPECESYDVVRGKSAALLLVIVLSVYGAGLAVDQLPLAFLVIVVTLVIYYVLPAFQCRDCGSRFD